MTTARARYGQRPGLRYFWPQDDASVGSDVKILINGWPAHIHVWTAEEWASLMVRPSDAMLADNGCWLALRVA